MRSCGVKASSATLSMLRRIWLISQVRAFVMSQNRVVNRRCRNSSRDAPGDSAIPTHFCSIWGAKAISLLRVDSFRPYIESKFDRVCAPSVTVVVTSSLRCESRSDEALVGDMKQGHSPALRKSPDFSPQ